MVAPPSFEFHYYSPSEPCPEAPQHQLPPGYRPGAGFRGRKLRQELGVMVHILILALSWQRQVDIYEFKTSLAYVVSFWPARATQ